MSGTEESVIRMANQIARNFEVQGRKQAIAATADHITMFWDPRMKAAAFRLLEEGRGEFSPEARGALAMLAAGVQPASQTRATRFNDAHEAGHSDAG